MPASRGSLQAPAGPANLNSLSLASVLGARQRPVVFSSLSLSKGHQLQHWKSTCQSPHSTLDAPSNATTHRIPRRGYG